MGKLMGVEQRGHHPVRALVSSLQAEPARPGGDDGLSTFFRQRGNLILARSVFCVCLFFLRAISVLRFLDSCRFGNCLLPPHPEAK
jgi:hypothetical protein